VSYIRTGPGRYTDPWTRQPITPPGITPRPAAPPPDPILSYRVGRCKARNAVTDADVFAALRDWRGNLNAASIQLAMTREGIRHRVSVLEARGLLPEDIGRMVAARRPKGKVAR
jgi:hypothetical protein